MKLVEERAKGKSYSDAAIAAGYSEKNALTPTLLVSRERYAEFGLLFATMTHRQDCQVINPSALAFFKSTLDVCLNPKTKTEMGLAHAGPALFSAASVGSVIFHAYLKSATRVSIGCTGVQPNVFARVSTMQHIN
jgi:hypothetical protein